jgi:hypothetical protein
MGKRVRKAVGTYGMSDMLRNPARQIRISSEGPPGREAGSVDIAAVRAGEARRVSCFLRGTLDPFPRRLKQGDLFLSARELSWKPFWGLRRTTLPITIAVTTVYERAADEREPNLSGKPTGGYRGVSPGFTVITCYTFNGDAAESVDFVVPDTDAPLVLAYFNGELDQSQTELDAPS